MGLTEDQVMEDAERLVVDLLTDLSAANLTPQNETIILADAKRVLEKAALVIEVMVMGTVETFH